MDTDTTTVRLVVHVPQVGRLYLKPLSLRDAVEVVLAAYAAGVRVERLPETGPAI